MSDHRRRRRATEIVALAAEAGAPLPAHGSLLPMLLGAPDDAGPWACIRCGAALTAPARYSCSGCLAHDDAGERWIGRRPPSGRPP